jgi:hypothetical protein
LVARNRIRNRQRIHGGLAKRRTEVMMLLLLPLPPPRNAMQRYSTLQFAVPSQAR